MVVRTKSKRSAKTTGTKSEQKLSSGEVVSDTQTSEEVEVPIEEAPNSKISVGIGTTRRLRDEKGEVIPFESIRIDVRLDVPYSTENDNGLWEAFEFGQDWCETRINEMEARYLGEED